MYRKSAHRNYLTQNKSRGFTLVELLVVITIIVILGVVAWLAVNPIEVTKQGRDSARIGDLASLKQAIDVAVQEATGTSSLDILCVGGTAPCTGTSNPGTAANRKNDGTGWTKVNISAQKAISMPVLPVDQTNDATYHYTYYSDGNGYELNAVLESSKFSGQMGSDGGNNDNVYEIGSNLNLLP